MERIFTVLVAEDVEATRLLMGLVIEEMGHEVWYAENGLQAVEQCRRDLPDLILMDMMMPVMDGHEAMRQIRELCAEHWIPIIFLSAKSDEESHISSLDVGADDYLPKPINLTMLAAKIRVMQRISEMQRRISEDSKKLRNYYTNNEREQAFAKHVLDSIVGSEEQQLPGVSGWQLPAEQFSGDVLARAMSPTGQLCLMLADSTGHGLSAALACLPAVDIFYAMVRRGFPLTAMAREINVKLNRLLPIGRFVAAALVTVDWELGCVEVWNGGIPCVMFVGDDGRLLKEWRSQYPPLGILNADEFCWGSESYFWEQSGHLIVCSDGLTEAKNPSQRQFGNEGICAVLREAGDDDPLSRIRQAVLSHLDGAPNRDDISLASIRLKVGADPFLGEQAAPEGRHDGRQLSHWQVKLAFDADELKLDQTIPLLIGWLNQLGFRGRQFKQVLLIVTELFNNALDHGVLRLDSSLKDQSDGYERYFKLRRERLAALREGGLELSLERVSDEAGWLIRVGVSDSGAGFDHPSLMERLHRQSDDRKHGRGIALVNSLCSRLAFHGNGNEVVAEFRL
ncbi:fused response regulator/phosphatase [Chromobacterium sp. IIBBL 290-4]|uniref:ATP-binding SpoIIE family protein phosphatase n=1 Tax=Chromobacterium sp. IIBBL 290-4 TaxID=2953890 RepID=UPI0020B76CE1|nr:fused response regulator/phosphatase [Chromobacterium sp. IIBBL 290-4]UTH73894.1 fused response regulator/phosphatase [Chromobacterium sp. IIBBL 290-4]